MVGLRLNIPLHELLRNLSSGSFSPSLRLPSRFPIACSQLCVLSKTTTSLFDVTASMEQVSYFGHHSTVLSRSHRNGQLRPQQTMATSQEISRNFPTRSLPRHFPNSSAQTRKTKNENFSGLRLLTTLLPACELGINVEKTQILLKIPSEGSDGGRSLTWYFLCLGSSRCKQDNCAQCSQRPRATQTGFFWQTSQTFTNLKRSRKTFVIQTE